MTTAGGALRYTRLRAPPALSEQDTRCATARNSPRMRSSPGEGSQSRLALHRAGKANSNAFHKHQV